MRPLNTTGTAEPVGRLALRMALLGKRMAAWSRALQEWRLPSFPVIAVTLLSSTALYGSALGGHAPAILDAVSEPFGYTLEHRTCAKKRSFRTQHLHLPFRHRFRKISRSTCQSNPSRTH